MTAGARRVLAVVALAFVGLLTFAPQAQADTGGDPNLTPKGSQVAGTHAVTSSIDGCKSGPMPESPADGFAAQMLPTREGLPQGAKATPYETYGLAGLNWESFNLGLDVPLVGCVPNSDAIAASTSDSIANLIMGGATAIAAFANSISRTAYDLTWTSVFDPFLQQATDSLRGHIFDVYVPMAVVILGMLIIFKANKSQYSQTATMVGGGLLVMVTATMIFSAPLLLVHGTDNLTAGIVGGVASRINGDQTPSPGDTKRTPDVALMNSMYDNVLYRSWVGGTLGNPDGPTAKKYAKDLFAAQTLSWNEAPLAVGQQKNGASTANLISEKQKKYVEIADKIEKEDPEAYANLQGLNGRERIWYALLCLVAVLLTLPVILIGSLAMVTAVLVSRLVLVLVPIIFPAAVVKPTIAMDAWDRVASICITAVIWGIGIPILTLLDAAALQASLSPAVQLLLLFGLALAALATLWGFAPGFSGALRKKHAKKGFGLLQTVLGKATEATLTGVVAGRVARGGGDDDAPAAPAPDDDGTYSVVYDSVNRGNRPDPDPSALPAGASREPVDAEVLPDEHVDDTIDVDYWEPAGEIGGGSGRELPAPVYTPDEVKRSEEVDADVKERGLPSERDPAEVGRQGDDAVGPIAPVWYGEDDEVYPIYSGESEWVEPEDLPADETYMGEGAEMLALPAGSSGGGE